MPVFSYQYSFPYIIFLIYLSFLMFWEFRNINSEKGIKLIEWATILGFLFFFGCRGLIFTDWAVYYPMFDKMPTLWEGQSIFDVNISELYGTDEAIDRTGTEMGFIYYVFFFKSIIPNFYIWVFFCTAIDLLLLHFFIKRYSPYYVLAFLCFYIFDGLGIEANLMRNIKSILIFLLSLRFLEERKLLPYMLLNTLGFLIHSSAIIYFPLYFFLNRKWSKKVLWIIFSVGVVILFFQLKYIAPILLSIGDALGGRIGLMIQFYLASDLYNSSFGLFHFGYLERVFSFVIIMILYEKIIDANKRNIIFINAFVIHFAIYFYLSEITVIIERLPLLFVFSYWILYPTIFKIIESRRNKVLFLVLLIAFSFAKIIKSNNNILVRYDNALFNMESYEQRLEHFINNSDYIEEQ